MDLLERAICLAFGGLIGFALGYVVRYLQEIKEELHEVDELIQTKRNDGGFVRNPLVLDVALVIVVLVTVWAAFASQAATNNFRKVVDCTTDYNIEFAEALESRDLAAEKEIDSEIKLWEKYERLFERAKENPDQVERLQERLNGALAMHRAFLSDLKDTRDENPYPSPYHIRDCKA